MLGADDLDGAEEIVRLTDTYWGHAIVDHQTGMIDWGRGFRPRGENGYEDDED